jgi:hypothetical protein
MPYGDVREDQLLGGIVFELTQAIGLALNVPVRYVVLPRNRLEAAAQAGEIDVRCSSTRRGQKLPNSTSSARPCSMRRTCWSVPGIKAPSPIWRICLKAQPWAR